MWTSARGVVCGPVPGVLCVDQCQVCCVWTSARCAVCGPVPGVLCVDQC